jgi:pyridoxine kinase
VTSVLTIQSSVAYGYVGNAAALPVLQRLGVEAWPVQTAVLSNHTAHPGATGGAVEPAAAAAIVEGLADVGALDRLDGVLSGYLARPGMAAVVADAVARSRAANADLVYLCDPAVGRAGRGFFIGMDVMVEIGELLLPLADIVTPNAFELSQFTHHRIETLAEARDAAEGLRAAGPATVVCTSIPGAADEIVNLVASAAGAWTVTTPRIDAAAHGAGDVLAALFLAHTLAGMAPPDALARAVSGVYAVLQATAQEGGLDLALIESLDTLATPPEVFPAERLE